jgi:hypothetical protein
VLSMSYWIIIHKYQYDVFSVGPCMIPGTKNAFLKIIATCSRWGALFRHPSVMYFLANSTARMLLGTEATVTNLENGQSVEITINDRGPHSKGRDIDLSKEAGKEIGIRKDGVAPVKIEAKVSPEEE